MCDELADLVKITTGSINVTAEIEALDKKSRVLDGPYEVNLPEIGRASVVFDFNYQDDRMYTFCVIRLKKGAGLSMGISVKHPGDEVNYRKGRAVAFDRALGQFYPHVSKEKANDFISENLRDFYFTRRNKGIEQRRLVWAQLLEAGF